jgi:hypothetical protein
MAEGRFVDHGHHLSWECPRLRPVVLAEGNAGIRHEADTI